MDSSVLEDTLITGAEGMVGSYIDFGTKTTHRNLDVTDLAEVRRVMAKHRPKTVIHLAAEVDFDRCERDIALAYNVNAVGTYNVAIAAREVGALVVYISTSAVFSGEKEEPYTVSDVPNPVSSYGHSKYLGELAVRGVSDEHIIARIAWVFGGGPKKDQKFVAKMLRQLDQPLIRVVRSVRGSPTYGKDLVDALKKLILEGKRGTFHMANLGSPTRVEMVQEILAITGHTGIKVEEVAQGFFGNDYVKRSDNESMESEAAYMRPWQDALREYIQTEWPETAAQSA